LPKTAKKQPAQQATQNLGGWSQSGALNYGTVSMSSIAPTNIQWQGTTSGATYTAASSVLTT